MKKKNLKKEKLIFNFYLFIYFMEDVLVENFDPSTEGLFQSPIFIYLFILFYFIFFSKNNDTRR